MDTCLSNFAFHLKLRAERTPGGVAYVFPSGAISYAELERESDALAGGLHQWGVRKGTRIAFLVPPSREFFALAFALLKLGAMPILIDTGIGRRQIRACLKLAEPEVFIGIPRAHLGRLLLGWGRETVRLNLTVGGMRFPGWSSYAGLLEAGRQAPRFETAVMDPDEPAAVVFTSGSTGPSKGAIYTHRMLNTQAELLQKHHAIAEREISLATFPLFALFDPAMGVTSVVPKMDFTLPGSVNPKNILEPIRRHNVTHMFGSPALLKRVAAGADRSLERLTSLRRVLSAGAPIAPKILRAFRDLIPEDAEIFTPYGATEALPVTTISHRSILDGTEKMTACGAGVCVGMPFPELFVGIIRITDDPIEQWSRNLLLPPGETGEIVVSGANVSASYDRNPRGNRLAKIPDSQGRMYHRMGDLGYRDAEGRLWFCGRKSHRITTAGGMLFPVACEGIFNCHEAVYRTALVGIGSGPFKTPALCVQLERAARSRSRQTVREELLRLGAGHPMTQDIRTILFCRSFPVDVRHNAKIFREKLAVWAERELS
jgi:acyl-CoA synthetase (AMP-forming)/AMP-acid ligase II